MIFNISVGFSDIVVKNNKKKPALFLGDTVMVNEVRSGQIFCYFFSMKIAEHFIRD